ncbi:MAG: threonine ammonia-lyase IlvA [Pseudomonadota bacterium]
MRELFPPTPLQHNLTLSNRYGAEIWLKREDLSPVRSYKIRGALNAMSALLASGVKGPFVCASAGNHAQGVAFAARHFGVKAVVFMPVTTPDQKVRRTATFGGPNVRIELTGDYFDESQAAARAYTEQEGGVFLPPFDSELVMAGQASVGVEIMDDLGSAPDAIVVGVGGGGLSAGLTSFFQASGAATEFWLVEPDGARSLQAALAAGAPRTLDSVDNFVDGASVARVGDNTFRVLAAQPLERTLGVPENRVCSTMLSMLDTEGMVLEPAGALTIDVLADLFRLHGDKMRGKRVVCITSGGNFDFERLPDVKERALRWEGRKKYFILRMPQRPGALRDFLDLLGPEDDITRFEYLKKSARNFGSVLIGLEAKAGGSELNAAGGAPAPADSFKKLADRVSAAGFQFRDITDDPVLAEFLI